MASLRNVFDIDNNLSREQLDTIDASSMGSLRRGYESGRLGTEANYNLARESSLRAAGDVAAADALRAQTDALQRRASIYAPAVGRVEDIDGIGSGASWLAGQIGSGAASMQDPMLASAALSAAGTGLSFVPHPLAKLAGAGLRMGAAPVAAYDLSRRQLKGEQYGNLSADPTVMGQFSPQEIDDQAGTYGMVAGLIDSALPAMVGRQLGGAALRARPRISPAASVPLGLAGEGVTEVAQGEGGRLQHGMLNPNRDASQDASLRLNEFLGGAAGAGGPVLAGAGAQALFSGGRATAGAVKDAAGSVVDMAKGAAGKAQEAVQDGVVDLKAGLKEASARPSQDELDDYNLMHGLPPASVDANDAAAYGAWYRENAPKRMARIHGGLTELADQGDERAAELLGRLNTPDKDAQETAMGEAASHLTERQGLEELAQEAARASQARQEGRGGSIAGRVMGTVRDAGKAVLGAVKGRKLNAQEPGWTGPAYEAEKQRNLNAFDEAGKEAGDKQRSYQRAELMGEIMAARAQAEVPRYSAHRVAGDQIPVLMKDIGEEIASLAESWAPPAEGKARVAEGTDKRTLQRFDALKLDLSRIARSMKAAYADPMTVVDDLRKTADPTQAPFFDYLQAEIEAGPAQAAQTRKEAQDALVKSIDDPTRTRLLQEGIDLQQPGAAGQLLKMVDGVARGVATPAARRELTKVLGKDNLERMLDMLYRQTPESAAVEEAYARQTETSTTDSGLQIDENGDVVDATEVTDFDKRQAEKAANKKPAARLYGFYGVPKPRNEEDPLAYDNEKVTKAAIKKWNEEAKALREMGQEPDYSTDPRQNDARRPRLFNLAQQGEEIEKRKLALEKQLKVDQTPERMLEMLRAEQATLRKKTDEESKVDLSARTKAIQKVEVAIGATDNPNAREWLDETAKAFFLNRAGSWRVEPRSAWNVMTEHDGLAEGAKPNPMFINKMLARYRDYMRQEAQRHEKSTPARAQAAREAMTLVNNTLLDRVDQSKGERPTRTTPRMRKQAWDDAQEFFKSHGMVVAERAPTEDAQTLTADRVLNMAKTGKKAAEASRTKDENGNLIPPPDVLVFRSTLADSRTSKPGDLYITTRELVAFAREARFATQGVDFENTDRSFSNKSKDAEYLRDLMDGITAVVDSGLVEGLPKIYGNKGKPQFFSQGSVPGDLPLATKTYAGLKYAQEKRIKDPNRKDRTTDPTDEEYQRRVASEQGREYFEPDSRTEIDPIIVDGRATRPSMLERSKGVGMEHLTGRDDRSHADRYTVDRSGVRYAEPRAKLAKEDTTVPSETERRNPGAVDDEFADQRRRSIIEGRTADGGAAAAKSFPKMKMADMGAEYGDALRRMFEASFEDGVAEAKTWLRQAAAPAYDKKGLTGGAHLTAPVVRALSGDAYSALGNTPAEKQEVRRLRIEAARVIAASDLKPVDKVRLARELALPEGRDRIVAANVQKFLEKIVPEGPPIDTRSARAEQASRAQNDRTSDEAVREYNADTGQNYGMAPSRDAALKEGAAPVGKLSARPSGAGSAQSDVTITAHDSSGYQARTKHNADSAGLTVAIAHDFETAGERLTRRVSEGKYLAVPIDLEPAKAGLRLAKAMRQLDTTTLNVAGNGIYTLAGTGRTQAQVNQHVYETIRAAHELRPITKIVTGGQTGVDIAGAIAARALGIPVVVTMPRGFRQRNAQGVDENLSAAIVQAQIEDGAQALNKGGSADGFSPARKLNAQATQLHRELGRLGFGATHDSPARHEGKFDWRKHLGKGEGNWVYGAGTYLSTADSVHKFYKKMFNGPTYQVSVDIPPERILAWAEPLAEQPASIRLRALKAIKDLKIAPGERITMGDDGFEAEPRTPLEMTGEDLYREIANKLKPGVTFGEAAPAASDYLQSLGILGHQYPSARRNTAEPNYVIYDDSKITTNFVAFSQQNPSSKVSTQAEMDEARNYVAKVLGPQIKVDFKALTGYSGEWIEAQNVIEISTTPGPGTMQVAYHEALHAFFSKFVQNNPQALEAFQALVDDKKLLARVEALLAGHPNAIAQLVDGEERLAYMYQFWAAGLLDLPTKKAGIFEAIKEFFRRVLGMVTDSERATAILEAFHAGKMSDPSVAGQVIAKELAYGTLTTKAARKVDAVVAKAQSLMLPSQMVLANSDSAAARELAPMLWTNPGDEEHGGKGEGYINARTAAARKYKNLLDGYIQGLSDRDLADVARLLQEGKAKDLASIAYAPHREAVKNIDALLQRFYRYMTDERGMQLGKINEGYFPRVWDVGTMLEKQSDFIQMLETKYDHVLADGAKSSGLTKSQVAQRIFEKIVSSSVAEHLLPQRSDGVLSPFFSSGMMRELNWLDAADSAPYQSKDLIGTLTSYFHSGARAAEYTHRFGQDGGALAARLKTIEQELIEAGAARFKKGEFKTAEDGKKWAERRMAQVHKSVGAIEGTLGSDIGSAWRNTSAWITVYENLRLLPLTLFASVVDPLGMVARGATMRQAYDTFLRGMREVFANWGDMMRKEPKERQADKWEKLALAVGSVDAAMFSHHVADEYSSMYMSKKAARVNDAFFRLNGMESWNKGVRIGATQAAVNFLERHAKLPEVHSARWLKELGLTPADLTFDQDGSLVADKNVLAAQKGITREQAEVEVEKVHQAIRRWVEGAVLTPNAAQRPAWASDPHYSMFFHLKQFSYSFHQTVLKRAVKEMNYGNMSPMGAFLWYIPVMIASDVMKGLLQGGGSLPSHMQGMSLGDWTMRAINRSGLLGVGSIGVDAEADVFSLAGPAVEQTIDAFGQPIGRTIVDALPGKPLIAEALR